MIIDQYVKHFPNDLDVRDETERKDEEDYNDDNDEFWGYKGAERCCKLKAEGKDCSKKGECTYTVKHCTKSGSCTKTEHECQKQTNGRARLTSSEIGFYLDFDFSEDGIPTGCPEFDEFFDEKRENWPDYDKLQENLR